MAIFGDLVHQKSSDNTVLQDFSHHSGDADSVLSRFEGDLHSLLCSVSCAAISGGVKSLPQLLCVVCFVYTSKKNDTILHFSIGL